ncbi:hypothetical protein HUJ04_007011 [Dendroctonus ponderosae]|nr:hypothetical protein HUJ04_007011 [Dendroctonus ponderosae]
MLIHSLCPSVKESSIVMGSCRPLQDISECGNDNSLEPAENIAEVSYSQSGLFSISHRSKKATKRKALHNAFDQVQPSYRDRKKIISESASYSYNRNNIDDTA